jgi:hypothetical protein
MLLPVPACLLQALMTDSVPFSFDISRFTLYAGWKGLHLLQAAA